MEIKQKINFKILAVIVISLNVFLFFKTPNDDYPIEIAIFFIFNSLVCIDYFYEDRLKNKVLFISCFFSYLFYLDKLSIVEYLGFSCLWILCFLLPSFTKEGRIRIIGLIDRLKGS